MQRLITTLLTLIAAIVAAGLTANVAPTPATAQTPLRGAPVKNVDEPGRAPYQVTAAQPCLEYPCRFDFDRVPMGKRLVIEYVGGLVSTFDADGTPPRVEMHTSCRPLSGCGGQPGNPIPVFRTFEKETEVNKNWGIGHTMRAYVEEGASPGITLSTGAFPHGSAGVQITITGYLIDKSN